MTFVGSSPFESITIVSASPIEFRTVIFPFSFGFSSSSSTERTGSVSVSLKAIPVMPDCHGRLNSRFGSKFGCFWTSTRFLMLGMAALSSFSAHPFLITCPR